MPLLGQASGGWTESSSALRILHVGIRNTVPVLTDDAFTQTNPPVVTTAGTVSAQVDQTKMGVLSGAVAFSRPDAGSAFIGGMGSATVVGNLAANLGWAMGFQPLGCFINSANGNPFENTPGTASGKGPYVSSMGTYGNALFETNMLVAFSGTLPIGSTLQYTTGMKLIPSINGYLMPAEYVDAGAVVSLDIATLSAEASVKTGVATFVSSETLGVVLMPPDAVQNEIVYDQRI